MQEKNVWYVFRFYNSTFHLCGHTSYSSVGCERLFELPWRQHTRKYYRVEHLNQEVTQYNISSFGNWLNTKNTITTFLWLCVDKRLIFQYNHRNIFTHNQIFGTSSLTVHFIQVQEKRQDMCSGFHVWVHAHCSMWQRHFKETKQTHKQTNTQKIK